MSNGCPVCGYVQSKNGRPRSVDQLRRYFALIRAAFTHWPENSERQFSSEEELRAFVAAQIPLVGLPRDKALMVVEASIRAAGSYCIPTLHKGNMVIWKPKSIAFHKMGPAEFNLLSDAVSTVIEQETGLKVEQLLKEHEAAA